MSYVAGMKYKIYIDINIIINGNLKTIYRNLTPKKIIFCANSTINMYTDGIINFIYHVRYYKYIQINIKLFWMYYFINNKPYLIGIIRYVLIKLLHYINSKIKY